VRQTAGLRDRAVSRAGAVGAAGDEGLGPGPSRRLLAVTPMDAVRERSLRSGLSVLP